MKGLRYTRRLVVKLFKPPSNLLPKVPWYYFYRGSFVIVRLLSVCSGLNCLALFPSSTILLTLFLAKDVDIQLTVQGGMRNSMNHFLIIASALILKENHMGIFFIFELKNSND